MQSIPPAKVIQIFYSYASADKEWRIMLENHLSGLKHKGLIAHWHHDLIPPGKEPQETIDQHLNEAHIILLLVSSAFMAPET